MPGGLFVRALRDRTPRAYYAALVTPPEATA